MTVEGSGAAQTQDTAERLRGFGPVGLLAIFAIIAGSMAGPLVSAVLVLAWAQPFPDPHTCARPCGAAELDRYGGGGRLAWNRLQAEHESPRDAAPGRSSA
jgi:hypothetical protein